MTFESGQSGAFLSKFTRHSTRSGRITLARFITGVRALFAFIEIVYVLLLLFNANQGNGSFSFVRSLADPLALFFPGLCTVSDHVGAVLLCRPSSGWWSPD